MFYETRKNHSCFMKDQYKKMKLSDSLHRYQDKNTLSLYGIYQL